MLRIRTVLPLLLLVSGCLDIPPFGSAGMLVEQDGDVLWVTPTASVFTNGAVTLEVSVTGPADAIELYKDTTLLARLTEPPFRFVWDTVPEAEGTYVLSAHLVRADRRLVSSTRSVTVDRTPPTVVSRSPAAGDANVPSHAPV